MAPSSLLTAVGIDLKAANLRVEAGAEAPPFSEGSMSRSSRPRRARTHLDHGQGTVAFRRQRQHLAALSERDPASISGGAIKCAGRSQWGDSASCWRCVR